MYSCLIEGLLIKGQENWQNCFKSNPAHCGIKTNQMESFT